MIVERADEELARAVFRSAHMDLGLASPGATAVLHALLVRAGSTVSRQLLGTILSLSPSTVSSYICQLRFELQRLRLLETLETVHNMGYRIKQSAAIRIVQRLRLNEIESSRFGNDKNINEKAAGISVVERSFPQVILVKRDLDTRSENRV
jgi:DNA-binding winged helix-turn-helix (wHTH) protein